jgi:hemoglobin
MNSETRLRTHYERIGGGEAIRELVERFYDLMELEAEFAGIRALHATTLDAAREKLYLFLCGWTGGPQLYVEQYGHPRLRARHLPFSIGESERDQWMACMRQAMDEVGVEPELKKELTAAFYKTADFMRNREG